MVPLSMTFGDRWPWFQGHNIFLTLNISDTTQDRAISYYRTSIGNRMLSIEWWYFQWPWRTPNLVFKVSEFLKSNIKYCVFYGQSFYRTLIGNHTQSIEWYHFQWLWVTSDPDFKVTTFFEVEYLKDKITIVEEETIPNIWNGAMFGDLDWPLNAWRGFVIICWASCHIKWL